jgi:hypothetical protein
MTNAFTNLDETNVIITTNGNVVTYNFHVSAVSIVRPWEFWIAWAVFAVVVLAVTWWLLRRRKGKSNQDIT